MASKRTYQAVGFVTWHGARLYLRRRVPDIGRDPRVAAAAAATALALVALGIRNSGVKPPIA